MQRRMTSAGVDKEITQELPRPGTSHTDNKLIDQPPRQIVRHSGSCIIASITRGSCNNPRSTGMTCHRRCALRATPPLLYHRVGESLLTYTAASHP
ncbi:hypothetical protein AVEN_162222-1 [Araneus ventricosus]|uniref:Uncharacterized protein n=1 Tax=Araneus ventricosus TaxID=182803 RepID=A0A4Y2EXT7_ARAVE|nr:hypothetical protein AVEN_162222-1 [Araneus ventricosus]